MNTFEDPTPNEQSLIKGSPMPALLIPLLASFTLAACGGLESAQDSNLLELAEVQSELSAVECRPGNAEACDRGDSCLTLSLSESSRESITVCANQRCLSSRECGDGYVCRLDHCIAVERDRPDRTCPRGTVPGIPQCAEGYEARIISRDPVCGSCERIPERCDPTRPTARGNCERILGFYWNGRSCTPLSGCAITNTQGLFRTPQDCQRAHASCTTTTPPTERRAPPSNQPDDEGR